MQLTTDELVALLGWPIGSPVVAGLPQARTRHLPATESIARRGRVIARSNFPGAERPLALSISDSCKHLHVCGPTGTGKTVLLANLVAQDMAAGHGVVVIEGKGGRRRGLGPVLEAAGFRTRRLAGKVGHAKGGPTADANPKPPTRSHRTLTQTSRSTT